MKIPLHPRGGSGFTLIEVMLAVLIMALTTFGIFRFVLATQKAVAASVSDTEEQLDRKSVV